MTISLPTPTRLYVFQYALIEDGTPMPGYLVQTSDGKNILIDTGFPNDDAFRSLNRPPGRSIVQLTPVLDQLAALGLTPRDIHFLVCTHFDPDHAGGHDAFLWSELIVQRAHYEFARASEGGRTDLARPHWDHPSLRYRLIEGDVELVPGVELIETSGHLPGHQAVLVRLPHTGPILLAIDAAAMEVDLDPATRQVNSFDFDADEARESARKMFELVKREKVALTIFGHDENLWPTLKLAPAYYD